MSKDNGGPGWWFPILLGPNAALTILSTWIGETVGAFSYNQQDSRIWRAKMDRQNRADPRRDDSKLHDDTRQPGQAGRAGGSVATDVGTRDEEKSATGADPEPTRVTKSNKVQPKTRTRSDHRGAGR
jgi:hypothetical protein